MRKYKILNSEEAKHKNNNNKRISQSSRRFNITLEVLSKLTRTKYKLVETRDKNYVKAAFFPVIGQVSVLKSWSILTTILLQDAANLISDN